MVVHVERLDHPTAPAEIEGHGRRIGEAGAAGQEWTNRYTASRQTATPAAPEVGCARWGTMLERDLIPLLLSHGREEARMLFRRTKGPRAHYERTELSAYLDERSDIEGTCTFSGTVLLNGKFKGLIQSTDTLIVGEKGVVNANINGGCVLIRGEVVGNVIATERVELLGHAQVFGDVEAPVIIIEEGVLFEGHCRMTKTGADNPAARDLSVVNLKR